MWLSKLRIRNVKSHGDSGEIDLSRSINLFVAPNNAGKTTILRCIYALQENEAANYATQHPRLNGTPQVDMELSEVPQQITDRLAKAEHDRKGQVVKQRLEPKVQVHFTKEGVKMQGSNGTEQQFVRFKALEDYVGEEHGAWIYPFLSNRRASEYDATISATHRRQIAEGRKHIYSKIDDLLGTRTQEFMETCKRILGIQIGCIQVDQGKIAGFVVGKKVIPLSEMGEGTQNLLQLVRDLIVSKNNLFLLEEPENDIHPKALKALLEFILEKAATNQFIVSTHSNIVAKYLGAGRDAALFKLLCEPDEAGVPTTTVTKIETQSAEARLQLLEDLGYEVADFDLWSAYLLLEESSAERVINDILIPEFVPGLRQKVRTIACKGVDDVAPRFESFLRLFVFLHKAEIYREKAWVVVDSGDSGSHVIKRLRNTFQTWPQNHFRLLEHDNFEKYYPACFKDAAEKALQVQPKQARQVAKNQLLQCVLDWARSDRNAARTEFESSAQEVIGILKEIALALGVEPYSA